MSDFIPALEQRIHQFMQESGYRPMKKHEIAGALGIPPGDRRAFRRALQTLEKKGLATCIRKNRWAIPRSDQFVKGDLSVHPKGFGFVTPLEPGQPDIYISKRNIGPALHTDHVQVALDSAREERGGDRKSKRTGRGRGRKGGSKSGRPTPSDAASNSGPQGRIIRVLERRLTTVAGLYMETPHYAYVIPDNPRILHNIHVTQIESAAKSVGSQHHVVVRLDTDSNGARAELSGVVIEDLGHTADAGVEMLSLIRGHGLTETFPEDSSEEADQVDVQQRVRAETERRDLRDQLIFTIDPDTARDFDDAVSLTRLPDGQWQLGVHIADVAAYVEPGTALDREARRRGNSVYLVDRVITMLPRRLTEEVCSLSPDEDRLTHSVVMVLDDAGKVVRHETFPSIIRSKQRLTYDQVQDILDDKTDHDMAPSVCSALKEMNQLAQTVRRRRADEGSILFSMPEVQCVLDDQGEPVRLVKRIPKPANELIEEFMLLANRTVARIIAQKGFPVPYRIHEPPDEEQWSRMAVDLNALGFTDLPQSREELNAIAVAAVDSPAAHMINLAMLRNLKRAVYAEDRDEHFGLAFTHYLHFTSPIRRYPDFVVHRVLKAIERNEKAPYQKSEIEELAQHCTRTEREAAEAENESVELKRIAYYEREHQAGRNGPFEALVTSIIPKGLLVELTETLQRGLVPFSLFEDYFHVNEMKNRATGKHTRKVWSIGDLVNVEIMRVDTVRKLVDFRPAQRIK